MNSYFVRDEVPVPALYPRSMEVVIHTKYMYKVTLNMKTFKAFKCILTLLILT